MRIDSYLERNGLSWAVQEDADAESGSADFISCVRIAPFEKRRSDRLLTGILPRLASCTAA